MPRTPKPDPERYCERCGKRLHRKRYGKTLEDLTRFKTRRYCSLRCANSRGIHSKSSTSQHRISHSSVKERCESCGTDKHLHVHHRNQNWRDHKPENLITLCVRCHLHLHKRPDKICKCCSRKARRHGMCQKHFQRWKKYGDSFLTKQRLAGTPNACVLVRVQS